MGRENLVVDTAAMSGRRDHARERLVGYRAEVRHGEPVSVERSMDGIEGYTALGDDIEFLRVDLQ